MAEDSIPVTSRTVGGLYVRESGTPGSPAIVFLHGVGTSGGMWTWHMARLVGYHCVAPDLPGFGRSSRLPWISRSDAADRVAALIETRVPSRRAHVVGLSLGGSVAHTLLGRRAELLDRVVIDGCGALPWWGTTLLKLAVAAVSPVLHTRPVIAAIGGALALDDATRADLRAASPRAFRRGFADANDTTISREELAAACPTLLVAGERETRPPVRASNAALAALMPRPSPVRAGSRSRLDRPTTGAASADWWPRGSKDATCHRSCAPRRPHGTLRPSTGCSTPNAAGHAPLNL
jgi:pimeloyl-ACP methyl ester carboxylesterase